MEHGAANGAEGRQCGRQCRTLHAFPHVCRRHSGNPACHGGTVCLLAYHPSALVSASSALVSASSELVSAQSALARPLFAFVSAPSALVSAAVSVTVS